MTLDKMNESWDEATNQLKALGALLTERYQQYESEPGTPPPSEDDVRAAMRTLGNSATAAIAAFADVASDADVRSQARLTGGRLIEAVAVSVSGLVDDLATPAAPLGTTTSSSSSDDETDQGGARPSEPSTDDPAGSASLDD